MASRSLGTLTVDLVARTGGFVQGMDRAERASQKWRRQTERHMRDVGRVVRTGAALAVGGLTAMTVQTVNSVTELKNLAAVANTSTQTLQRMSFASQRMGVDQDKLADILKDVNDRVGDFIQTGGGPMVDFFENIAPKVGVTAEQFAKLSGPDALQLFVDSLEAANLSQADMVFYMEAMASDSTRLLPLLRNNGEELRRLGDEAERTGNVFSEMEIGQLENIKQGLNELTAAATGMKNQVTLAALPAIEDLTGFLSDPQTIENAQALGTAIVSTMSAATEAINRVVGAVRFVAEELAAIRVGVASDDIVRLEREADRIREILEGGIVAAGERIRFFGPDGIISFASTSELEAELAKIDAAIQAHYETANRPTIPAPSVDAPGTPIAAGSGGGVSRTNTLIEEQIKLLQQQADVLGMTARQQALYKLEAEGATDAQLQLADSLLRTNEAYETSSAIDEQIWALQIQHELLGMTAKEQQLHRLELEGATDAQLRMADAILTATEAQEAQIEAAREATRAQEDQARASAAQFKSVVESLPTQEEAIQESYERRREIILANTEQTGEAQTELMRRLEQERQEQLAELNDENSYWEKYLESAEEAMESMDEMVGNMLEQLTGGMGDAFESMIFDAESLEGAVTGMAEGMARSVINALGQMAAQWLAYQAVQMMTARTTEAAAVAGAATTGPAIAAAYAPAAAATSLATLGANTGPAMAGISMVAALASSALTGMAHDGIDSVPQTGTWLLQKGERVTTAETSAKLDGLLDSIQRGGGPSAGSINQTINVAGSMDRKTATQLARDSERRQRKAQARLGG